MTDHGYTHDSKQEIKFDSTTSSYDENCRAISIKASQNKSRIAWEPEKDENMTRDNYLSGKSGRNFQPHTSSSEQQVNDIKLATRIH